MDEAVSEDGEDEDQNMALLDKTNDYVERLAHGVSVGATQGTLFIDFQRADIRQQVTEEGENAGFVGQLESSVRIYMTEEVSEELTKTLVEAVEQQYDIDIKSDLEREQRVNEKKDN